jgi:hypothetical protein
VTTNWKSPRAPERKKELREAKREREREREEIRQSPWGYGQSLRERVETDEQDSHSLKPLG